MAKESAKEVTKQMIEMWDMTNIDWMGYEKEVDDVFSYHHLKVAKRNGGPISIDNGAILCGKTAHPYLHVVERYDRDMFLFITKILIQVNDQNYMPTYDQLLRIDAALNIFENEHCGDTNKKGYPLVKESFAKRLVKKKDFYFFE
jgi:hypothetical protein